LPEPVIRALLSFEEFEKLVGIQREVWKHGDLDVTPVHQFAISSRMGGILLGAYVGPELAGFVYSFPAEFRGKRCQHSHLLAVLPEYQGCGIGKALKKAQREEALARGYDLITWTFDPLQSRNANLNLQALGAVARTYLPNFYGFTPSLNLAPGLPTDRLLIEWPIKTARVRDRLEGRKRTGPAYKPEHLPTALRRKADSRTGPPVPARPSLDLDARTILVEVPPDVKAVTAADPGLTAAWQNALRRVMTAYFGRGYRAEHFIFDERSFYVLVRRRGPQAS
jgi:predicted GNAT superfamily acetyltransferase